MSFFEKKFKKKLEISGASLNFFQKNLFKIIELRIFEKKLEKRLPPQVLGNKFMVFRSLVAARPLQELRSRRLMSQRNSHFPKHLKPSRPQRLQRLAGDACQCEGVNCRLRIASSGSATIVAQDRRQKAKLLRNWTSEKHFLPSHQNGRSRKDPSKIPCIRGLDGSGERARC